MTVMTERPGDAWRVGEPELIEGFSPRAGDSVGLPDRRLQYGGERRACPRWLLTMVVGGWLCAAVLAVVAPFLAVTSVVVNGHRVEVDGWGRDPYLGVLGAGHGVAFGWALSGCAAMFVTVAIVAGRVMRPAAVPDGTRRSGALGRAALCGSLVAPGVTAGVALSMLLTADAYAAGIRVRSAAAAGSVASNTVGPPSVGPCVWLTAAAVACSACATYAFLRFVDAGSGMDHPELPPDRP